MKHSFLICIALISILFTSPSTQSNALTRKLSESVISSICRKTSDSRFCTEIISSEPLTEGADVTSFAYIAIHKLAIHLRKTGTYLHELQGGKEAAAIKTCIKLYKVGYRTDMETVIVSWYYKAYAKAKQAVGRILNDEQGCQQEVAKNPSPKWNALSSKNKYTRKLSQLSSDLLGLSGH